jgi:hypothetical protein
VDLLPDGEESLAIASPFTVVYFKTRDETPLNYSEGKTRLNPTKKV